jgi:rhodanese-related sulfurtransferase
MAIRNVFEHVKTLTAEIESVDVDGLKDELAQNDELLLIDLREIQELIDSGGIPGAIHVPRGMLEFWADPNSPYGRDYFGEHKRTIVFCASAGRSVYAVKALEDMGFSNVAQLAGGFSSWKQAGEQIEDVGATSRWMRREKE